jgi:hypothetical protein
MRCASYTTQQEDEELKSCCMLYCQLLLLCCLLLLSCSLLLPPALSCDTYTHTITLTLCFTLLGRLFPISFDLGLEFGSKIPEIKLDIQSRAEAWTETGSSEYFKILSSVKLLSGCLHQTSEYRLPTCGT